jgi:para-aminobenzoate synthetase/4-amino-4-deoxychorismate lyase
MPESTAILYQPTRQLWLRFSRPFQVIQAWQLEEVIPALERVEQQVNQAGLYAVGFISYEAGPAFDPALQAHALGDFPLLWFGLFHAPQESVDLPDLDPAGRERHPAALPTLHPIGDKSTYLAAIESIKEAIARGDTYQVNYTIRLQGAYHNDPWNLFGQMASAQGAATGCAYAAYLDIGDFVLCSASPELFFRLENETLTSKPMKGTTHRGLALADDIAQAGWLHYSEKNRAENIMIVDMLRNDMGRIAHTGTVQVPELFSTERYPTVWQMTSTVCCQTAASLVDIFRALFPCASITGAPKASTMRIIKTLEDTPRRIYTGCIGFIAPGRQAQFNVAIRTALVDRRRAQVIYGVGGGIVWDSTAEDEYDECMLKARVITQQTPRPAFDLLESLGWLPSQLWPTEFTYFLLDRHLQRLADSAEYFYYPFDRSRILEALNEAAHNLSAAPHKVRLLLNARGEIQVQAEPFQGSDQPVRLGIAPDPVDPSSPFLYHKTTFRQVYQQALAACPGCDDVILWNPAKQVTETCLSNILLCLDGTWYTPPIRCGLLGGTLRCELLERGEIHERVLTLSDLFSAQEIHIINSVRGRRRGLIST